MRTVPSGTNTKQDGRSTPIIDTHVHIWTHERAYPWPPETTAPPAYDAHPEYLLQLMEANSINAAVLVQYIGYRWDNAYVAQKLEDGAGKFMAVCRVNPEDPAAPEQLHEWTKGYGFHGVRLSPEADACGDWFSRPLMEPLFRAAADLGVPVVLLTKPSRLPDLVEILEHVPDVDVVIDHFADCVGGDHARLDLLSMLADNPRVFLKTGHIWERSSQDYPWRDTVSWIQQVTAIFGADRIMWGSDWPLCLRRAPYAHSAAYLSDAGLLSDEELSWILGRTARRIWPFHDLFKHEQALQPENATHTSLREN